MPPMLPLMVLAVCPAFNGTLGMGCRSLLLARQVLDQLNSLPGTTLTSQGNKTKAGSQPRQSLLHERLPLAWFGKHGFRIELVFIFTSSHISLIFLSLLEMFQVRLSFFKKKKKSSWICRELKRQYCFQPAFQGVPREPILHPSAPQFSTPLSSKARDTCYATLPHGLPAAPLLFPSKLNAKKDVVVEGSILLANRFGRPGGAIQ